MKEMISRVAVTCLLAVCVFALAPAAGDGPAFAGSKAPEKVTGLTLEVNAAPTAVLQWEAVGKKTDGYLVYRNGKKLAKVKKNATAYVDRTLKPGASYSYTVRAYSQIKKKTIPGKASSVRKITKGFTWDKSKSGSVKITGYTGHKTELVIPSRLSGKRVTEIGEEAFQGNLFINVLKIPEGVRRIDNYAFEACSGVKKIYYPKSLRFIGDGAFSGCAQMRLADLSDRVTHIGDGAFLYCMGLFSIELPADLKELGQFAFAGTGISKVWWGGDKLTYLPDRAFYNCNELRSIEIPASITSIGKRAFSGCENLGPVIFQGESIGISDYAFEKCDKLEPDFGSCAPGFGKQVFSADKETVIDLNPGIEFPEDAFIQKPKEKDSFPLSGEWDDDWSGDWPDDLPEVESKEILYNSKVSGGTFNAEDFAGFLDVEDGFDNWVEKYKEYNQDLPMTAEYNPYISLYTGNDHYKQMKAVLNHDASRWEYAVEHSGDDFAPMYLMMDHGLSAELCRGKMPQDLILYSGLKCEQVACFAGYPQGERDVTVSEEELVNLIGKEVIDEAYLSTSASISTAFGFAEEPANVVVKIYASQDAMDRLGTVCVDPFSTFSGEHEVLFNSFAHYKVLDVGEVTTLSHMTDGTTNEESKTYIELELK